MGHDELPRRLLIVYNSRARGQVFFKEFVKPVLDAAAMDYKTYDCAVGAAYDIAHDLKGDGGKVDGVVALSTELFREIVRGMQDRVTEAGEGAAVPLGFIPVPHQYGLAKVVGLFDDTSKTEMMCPPAMDIALGHTKTLDTSDLAYATEYADLRDERRRRLVNPDAIVLPDEGRLNALTLFTAGPRDNSPAPAPST